MLLLTVGESVEARKAPVRGVGDGFFVCSNGHNPVCGRRRSCHLWCKDSGVWHACEFLL